MASTEIVKQLRRLTAAEVGGARNRYAELLASADKPRPGDPSLLRDTLATLELDLAAFDADAGAIIEAAALEAQVVPAAELRRLREAATKANQDRDASNARIVSQIVALEQEIASMAFNPLTHTPASRPLDPVRIEECRQEIKRLNRERTHVAEDLSEVFTKAYSAHQAAERMTQNAKTRIREIREQHPRAFGLWDVTPGSRTATMAGVAMAQ